MKSVTIEAKHGGAFQINQGGRFEVTDPTGSQAVDFIAFPSSDISKGFSSRYTYRRTGKVRFEVNDSLYTTTGERILTMTQDDCGIHDLLLAPCNEWVVSDYYGQENEQGCRENLQGVLEPYGVEPLQLQEVLNLFTQVTITDHKYLDFREPPSKEGDTVEFRADCDAIVGIAPCSGESIVSNDDPSSINVQLPEDADINTNF